jgi:hypothetical protein
MPTLGPKKKMGSLVVLLLAQRAVSEGNGETTGMVSMLAEPPR